MKNKLQVVLFLMIAAFVSNHSYSQHSFGNEHIVQENLLENPTSIKNTDVDNDGDEDLIITSYYNDKVYLLKNDGEGRIFDTVLISENAVNVCASDIGDVDGDGDIDLIVSVSNDEKIILFENTDGLGNFGEGIQILEGNINYNIDIIKLLDIDNDSDIDLVVSYDNNLFWYENVDAAFSNQNIIDESVIIRTISFEDIDNDGDIDILAGGNSIFWYDNSVDNTFTKHNVDLTYFGGINSIALGDFDNNGHTDIVCATENNICISLNTGEAIFSPFEIVDSTDASYVFTADINSDNQLDVIYLSADFYADDNKVCWLKNTLNGTFELQNSISKNKYTFSYAIACEFTGDSSLDIIGISTRNIATLFENSSALQEDWLSVPLISSLYNVNQLNVGDFDGDDDYDILYCTDHSGSPHLFKIAWLENDNNTNKFTERIIDLSNDAYYLTTYIIDLDGDGDLDVLCGGPDKVIWYENLDGLGNFSGKNQISNGTFINSVFACDLDGDGDLDILTTSEPESRIDWHEKLEGAGSYGPAISIRQGTDEHYCIARAADFDNDGDNDVIAGSNNHRRLHKFSNNGDGSFGFKITLQSHVMDAINVIETIDINNDGFLDIICSNPSTYGANFEGGELLKNTGDGNFEDGVAIISKPCFASVVIDYDLDGDKDFIATTNNSYNDLTYGLRILGNTNASGVFDEDSIVIQEIHPTLMKASDFDGDGDIDLTGFVSEKNQIALWENIETIEIIENPQNTFACLNDTVTLIVAAENCDTYQWQKYNGIEFVNLNNNEIFHGVNTNQLLIQNSNYDLNNSKYRCHLQNIDVSSYSSEVILTNEDTIPPELTQQADVELFLQSDCTMDLPNYTLTQISMDNCDDSVQLLQIPEPGTSVWGMENQIVIIGTDNSLNTSQSSFTLSVFDTISPTIQCPENFNTTVSEGLHYSMVTTDFDPVEFSDNCEIENISNDYNNLSTLEMTHFYPGINTITWTATDMSGNTNSCSFTVTVNTTSIELTENLGINIYPNPTSGEIICDFGENQIDRFKIVNSKSELIIRKEQVDRIENINLKRQPDGLYFLVINLNKQTYYSKIIKQ